MSGFAKNILSPASTRKALAVGAATLLISGGAPLFAGASAAWACGDEEGVRTDRVATTNSAATAARSPAATHHGEPVSAFIPVVPTAIAAGGAPVEIGVEMANFTGADYARIAPGFALYNPHAGANLRIEDLKVEVVKGGQWRSLPLRHSCDPVLVADTSLLADPLTDQHAHRYLFRVSLSADAPGPQQEIQVFSGSGFDGKANTTTLKVLRTTRAGTSSAAPVAAVAMTSSSPAVGATAFVLLGGGATGVLRRRSRP